MLSTLDIRHLFLDYFRAYGHQIVASSPLIPIEDSSLLFTNSGMVQFKKIFLGQIQPSYVRAASSQKCLRVSGKHNDLDKVGRTAWHHTFFEMLGNFSFGDYFKAEAIDFAWQFLTKELTLPISQLYVTIYYDDDEAAHLWHKVAGIPNERIYRLGEKDNFWSMGDIGPCGPCSEIIFDQGEAFRCGLDCSIGSCDCDRFLEIWNLVFVQYDQIAPGLRKTLLKPAIDTGMGLERISAICQGVHSSFDIELFQEIIAYTANVAKLKYHDHKDSDTALRVIADHSRAIALLINTGILPSNEGRGYVLRRLIRRAFRFGRFIGFTYPFLHKIIIDIAYKMSDIFPELLDSRDFIAQVIVKEEERFNQTLDKGLTILEEKLKTMDVKGESVVSGEFAFKLYDTYGFPIDIINDIVSKQNRQVDENSYKICMDKQKERARIARKSINRIALSNHLSVSIEDDIRSYFRGYDVLECQSRIIRLLDINSLSVKCLVIGNIGWLISAETSFYGESGGQIGDVGRLFTPTGRAEVLNTYTLRPTQELAIHKLYVVEGEIFLDQEVTLIVSKTQRLAIARNHTATHVLNAALRQALGAHVKQAGSLVKSDRLRFDFTHITALTIEELQTVERIVNEASLANIEIKTSIMTYNEAIARGAFSLCETQYANEVRVVEVPGISIELCGGIHLQSTGQIGLFAVVSEVSIAAGMRRIEAVTGWNALSMFVQQRQVLTAIDREFKVRTINQPMKLVTHVTELIQKTKKLSKEFELVKNKLVALEINSNINFIDRLEKIAGVNFLAVCVDVKNFKTLRSMMDNVRSKLFSGVACLAAKIDDKVLLILYVSQDLYSRFTASMLIKEIATLVNGNGGGNLGLAQAGGTNLSGIEAAFARLRILLEQKI